MAVVDFEPLDLDAIGKLLVVLHFWRRVLHLDSLSSNGLLIRGHGIHYRGQDLLLGCPECNTYYNFNSAK